MKKNVFLFAMFVAMFSTTNSFAQISTAEPTVSVFKTGNRPKAGTYGIFFGMSYTDFTILMDEDVTFEGFPLVNLKYYATNNVELRLGLNFQGTSQKYSGEYEYEEYSEVKADMVTKTEDFSQTVSNRNNYFSPGFAYHFSNKNLLDVYAGATIPIGWSSNTTMYEVGETYYKTKQSPFILGLGGFIGLQAFIADLPFSIGVEYGLSFLKEFGNDTTKVTMKSENDEQTYYTSSELSLSDSYESLSSKKGTTTNDVRVTLSYYFNR